MKMTGIRLSWANQLILYDWWIRKQCSTKVYLSLVNLDTDNKVSMQQCTLDKSRLLSHTIEYTTCIFE